MSNGFSDKELLCVVTEEDYDKWEEGEYLYCGDTTDFDFPLASREEIIEKLRSDEWYEEYDFDDENDVEVVFAAEHIYEYDEFFSHEGFDFFEEEYNLSNGYAVVAFGYREIQLEE